MMCRLSWIRQTRRTATPLLARTAWRLRTALHDQPNGDHHRVHSVRTHGRRNRRDGTPRGIPAGAGGGAVAVCDGESHGADRGPVDLVVARMAFPGRAVIGV